MKKDKWVWMPHAGHLIVSNECRFHLNTMVGKYIVSTVGEYFPERAVREIYANVSNPKWLAENQHLKGDSFDFAYMKQFGFEEIGAGRKYETMVFPATKDSKNKCCPFVPKSWRDIDSGGYNTAEEAYKGHLKLCNKWSKKLT